MSLTTSQEAIYQRIRSNPSSKQAVRLSDDTIRALIYIAVRDLDLQEQIPDPGRHVPELFSPEFDENFVISGPAPKQLFESVCNLRGDADVYVSCLAALHKARLKYRNVLATQPFSTMHQVGMRGILQYGLVEVRELAALLVWRKWLYDIDNRAAQDTGYFVEPVLAGALGGIPYSAARSPIKRRSNSGKGRQVDCIKDDLAYEFKLRMTIAASGQGRWTEEIAFAEDCRSSGYTPVLLVLDPTDSPKLTQLRTAFTAAGGMCFIGDEAWAHLFDRAQPDMRLFLGKYIESPLRELFSAVPEGQQLPSLELHDEGDTIRFVIGDYTWTVERGAADPTLAIEDTIPDDAGDFLPGMG